MKKRDKRKKQLDEGKMNKKKKKMRGKEEEEEKGWEWKKETADTGGEGETLPDPQGADMPAWE